MITPTAQTAGLFTAPALAWVGAAAVSVPIIIHLMSRFRRRPEPWGAMRFLIEAYRKQRKRLQLEKLLLLLVRCLVVLLAGLALAGPVMSGCTRGGFGLGGTSGRIVYIVIDDALTSQTREAGAIRLDGYKQQAIALLDELEPDDRVVILRMATPVALPLNEPSADREQLEAAINGIVPRHSGGGLLDALQQVKASIDAERVRAGEAVVVLLSDFPQSADYFGRPVPPELEGLGDLATLVTALPAEGTDNLQVMALTPRRRMVVASETGVTVVGGRVKLRRFGGIAQPRSADLLIEVKSTAGEALAASRRTVTWPTGEREQGVNFDLPITLSADQLIGNGQALTVTASLMPDSAAAGLDALPADDTARAIVRLRSQMRVALIDNEQDVNPNPGELEPWQWVRAALTPQGPGAGGSFELTPVRPTSVNDRALGLYDAAVVLRPDELSPRGWASLRGFADQGGLVWVFSPALETEADWASAMQRTFDLPWQLGGAMVTADVADNNEPATVPLDQTTPTPEALQFLAADWREKLGWISVRSWLPFVAEQEDRWIALDASAPSMVDSDMPTLMARRRIGAGNLVFSAVPLDTRYTNLPIRALFVPLMHDTLRGVVGSSAGEPALTSGDRPTLGASWRGVGELVLQSPDKQSSDAADALLLQADNDSVTTRQAVDQPGVYRGVLAGSPRLLAVNPDANAGDTFGGRAQVEELLDQLGGWSYLNDKQQQGGVLARSSTRADLTAALLWVLLGLVVFETMLARWFSHATDYDRPTVVGRVLGALHGGGTPTPSQTGGRA